MNSPLISSLLTASGLPQHPNPYSLSSLQQMYHADRPYIEPQKPVRKPARTSSAMARLLTKAVNSLKQGWRQKAAAGNSRPLDPSLANCQG
ncbi:hypothetical protein ACTL6U_04695 [Rhodovibrionaceae bacterium A322]